MVTAAKAVQSQQRKQHEAKQRVADAAARESYGEPDTDLNRTLWTAMPHAAPSSSSIPFRRPASAQSSLASLSTTAAAAPPAGPQSFRRSQLLATQPQQQHQQSGDLGSEPRAVYMGTTLGTTHGAPLDRTATLAPRAMSAQATLQRPPQLAAGSWVTCVVAFYFILFYFI
jgi:hypothetical protein